MDRLAGTGLVVCGLGVGLFLLLLTGPGESLPVRQSFEIATGSAAGTYFPMGELIANVVSHPPGLARCEARGVCGPPGLIVSARSSEGAVANVLAVNNGAAASGLAQGNVVADAIAGRGAFRRYGPQRHIRVMADLFPEAIQLVVASRSFIRSIADLKGMRVSPGNAGSGGDVIAGEIVAAYGLKGIKLRRESYEASAGLLRSGEIDAFFFLGAAPSPLVSDLVGSGTARLVPIDGKARARLVARVPGLAADSIAAGSYRGTGAVETVSCRTLWITSDAAAPETVYGLLRALYHPANRALLEQGPPPARDIRLGPIPLAAMPLHPGAERFYREMGELPPPHLSQAGRR